MKKKCLFFIIVFFLLINTCFAKSCIIINGNGTNIGDEIECNGERFYIVNNDDDTIKALAKYNLNVGDNLESTDHFEYPGSSYTDEGIQYMVDYCRDNFGDNYTYRRSSYSQTSSTFICTYRYTPDNGEVKQDELYVGMAKTYVQGQITKDYGIVTFSQYQFIPKEDSYLDLFYDAEIKEYSVIDNYLKSYKDYLINSQINVLDVDLLAVSDIINILENDDVPTDTMVTALTQISDWIHPIRFDDAHNSIGNLSMLSSKYNWLYNTTYWTKTVNSSLVLNESGEAHIRGGIADASPHIYFINSSGNLCHTPYFINFLGVGIRPVITISKIDINYLIETKTNGNGEVAAERIEAPEGALVKFTVVPKPGYVLGEVKVIDSDGNVITFKDYTFTMPSSNVTIEATFVKAESEVINPKTKTFVSITIVILSIVLGILLIIMNKQKKELE